MNDEPIRARLEHDLAAALKGTSAVEPTTVRQLLAALQNAEIDKRGTAMKPEDVVAVLKREAKKRREAIVAYAQGGRDDLKAKEEQELAYIATFLPAELSEDAIRSTVQEVLAGISQPSVGTVMGPVMKALAGKADGAVVRRIVEESLSH